MRWRVDTRTAALGHQGKGHACGLQVVPVFCDAVGFEFFFKNERVVIAVQVPSGGAHQAGGRVVCQGGGLFDALVLGAGFVTAPP